MDQVFVRALFEALGGQSNIVRIDPYRMRIRVQVQSQHHVNEKALRAGPVLAVVRTQGFVQIVAGEPAQAIGEALKDMYSAVSGQNV